jgi:uncharacterized repeat protein (TIGR01451 family)
MMKPVTRIIVLIILLALLVPVTPAHAENGVKLTSTVFRQVEVENEQGVKVVELIPVDKALPGEALVIRITYANTSSEPARNIVIVNPVPDQMSYVSGSAAGDLVVSTFSIDSGKSFDLPEKLQVEGEDGKMITAPAGKYTHVRFRRIEALDAGQEDNVSFKAVLK